MCSPEIYLDDQEIKERSNWSEKILNDVEKISKDCICNRKQKFFKKKETEFEYVYVGVYRGMHTYCAEIPDTDFKKFSPNCRELAKEVDKYLVCKLNKPAVNGFFKPKLVA